MKSQIIHNFLKDQNAYKSLVKNCSRKFSRGIFQNLQNITLFLKTLEDGFLRGRNLQICCQCCQEKKNNNKLRKPIKIDV